MKRVVLLSAVAVLFLVGCNDSVEPPEGCRGHGGAKNVGELPGDATDGKRKTFVVCHDGTIVTVTR